MPTVFASMQKHLLVYTLRDELLDLLSSKTGKHYQGLACAARGSLSLSSSCKSELIQIDHAYNLVRHISQASIGLFLGEVQADLNGQGKWRAKLRRSKHNPVSTTGSASTSSGDEGSSSLGYGVSNNEGNNKVTDMPKVGAGSVKEEVNLYCEQSTQTVDSDHAFEILLERLHDLQTMVMETRADVLSFGCAARQPVMQPVQAGCAESSSEAPAAPVPQAQTVQYFQIDTDTEAHERSLCELKQFSVTLREKEKIAKLVDLLKLEANKTVTYVKSEQRAMVLRKLLLDCSFHVVAVHSKLDPEEIKESISNFESGADHSNSIMVYPDCLHPVEQVKLATSVINFDMPNSSETYLRRVGEFASVASRAVISFSTTSEDAGVLSEVQDRFGVTICEGYG